MIITSADEGHQTKRSNVTTDKQIFEMLARCGYSHTRIIISYMSGMPMFFFCSGNVLVNDWYKLKTDSLSVLEDRPKLMGANHKLCVLLARNCTMDTWLCLNLSNIYSVKL